jgi:hypothetical protein
MAELYTTIIKNNTATDRTIEELGITILGNTTYNLSEQFDFQEVFSSETLRSYISDGYLIVNNGITDLSASEGRDWIESLNTHKAREIFYSKTQLETSGESAVHWDNITNTPAVGAMEWIEPVKFRVTNITATTSGALPGDVIVDNLNYKKYDGSTWTTVDTVSDEDRIINLDDSNEPILIYNTDTTSWDFPEDPYPENPELSNAVMVNDDGDGKQAQYLYNGSVWKKIGDVDFTQHFDGDPSKHDASEIDVEGTYIRIPATPTNLETTISSIDSMFQTLAVSAANNNTLDEAYNENGSGTGRTINVDNGSIRLNASNGYAPIQLSQLPSAPNADLTGGQLCVVNGLLYVYDQTRLKWLSVGRDLIAFGRKGLSRNTWLSFYGGSLPSNNSGLRLMRNGVITGMSAQTDTAIVNGNADVHVKRNDSTSNISTITILSGTSGASDINYNIDIYKDEFLQCYLEKNTTGDVEDIMVMVEIAYTI